MRESKGVYGALYRHLSVLKSSEDETDVCNSNIYSDHHVAMWLYKKDQNVVDAH